MMNAAQLQQTILQGIPVTDHMGFSVLSLQHNSIRVQGRLAENINVHGTGFAGSLYSICTLALWGLVSANLPAQASLVLANASINYLKPVTDDIIAGCEIEEHSMQQFLQTLKTRGKARLDAKVTIENNHIQAVAYTGTVYAHLKKQA